MQDNQSAMRMEKNGKASTTGKSRHVHIRYFFIKDRVDKGEVELQYCPTLEMLADYFTKPLQGALFRKFWDVIMGYAHIDTLKSVIIDNVESDSNSNKTIEIKERVEQSLYNANENNCAKQDNTNENGARIKNNFGAKTYKSILLGENKRTIKKQGAVRKSSIKFNDKTNRTSTVLKLKQLGSRKET